MRHHRPRVTSRRIALAGPTLLTALALLGAALTACGTGRGGESAQKAPVTALEALRIALPELRLAHPDGVVESIYAVSGTGQELTAVWGISVWIPSEARVRMYHVRDSAVRPSSSSTGGAAPVAAPLVTLGSESFPSLLDSDRALAAVDAAGAAAFKRSSGVRLLSISLRGQRDGRITWEMTYGKPLTDLAAAALVNAVTGEVISYVEQNGPRSTATPRR